MANQEYGEALELARRYGLDCDLVYQRQWHQSLPVTVAAIEDYLVCYMCISMCTGLSGMLHVYKYVYCINLYVLPICHVANSTLYVDMHTHTTPLMLLTGCMSSHQGSNSEFSHLHDKVHAVYLLYFLGSTLCMHGCVTLCIHFDYLLIHVLSLQAHVSKLSWVLQECVHCVARDFLTMRDLLHYGRHISSFRSVTRHCSMFCEHA